MPFSFATIILRFVVSFVIVQSVAVAGILFIFKRHRNKRVLLLACACMAYLNAAYFFMFNPTGPSPEIKTLIDYFLMYPFFAYMLVCIALLPLLALAGAGSLLKRFIMLLQTLFSGKGASPQRTGMVFQEERREVMKLLASGIMLPVAGGSLYGSYIGKNRLRVENLELPFPDAPESLDGFRIAQISDIHTGPFMDERALAEIVQRINSLNPHIVVITGDIINWGSAYVEEAVRGLAGIQARHGVFAVLGNHDYYCEVGRLCSGLERAGIQVLRDRYCHIAPGGAAAGLYLIGIDDPLVRGFAVKPASLLTGVMKGIPEGGFTVLLSHRPGIFDHACRAGIRLTLAGHTHAGQVILPGADGHGISLARIAYQRDYGMYRSGAAYLYINRGLGVVGPPVRINCPQEITSIVVKRRESPVLSA